MDSGTAKDLDLGRRSGLMPALHARDECGRAMMICARLPDLFQLLQSDFRQCSLERLLRLLTTPGCDVGIVIGSPVRSPAGLCVSSPAKLAKRSVRRRSRRSPSTAGTVPHPPTKGCRSVLGPLAQPVRCTRNRRLDRPPHVEAMHRKQRSPSGYNPNGADHQGAAPRAIARVGTGDPIRRQSWPEVRFSRNIPMLY